MKRLWALEELNTLTTLWPSAPLSKILDTFPDRTYYAINLKASRLGVKREDPQRYWSEKDIAILEQYPTASVESLATSLNRSHSSIRKALVKNWGGRRRKFDLSPVPMLLSDFQKGLLVGLIEGDGTIGLHCQKERYKPYVAVYNTDRSLIQAVLNLSPLFRLRERVNQNHHHGQKPIYEAGMVRLQDVYLVLVTLQDCWLSERKGRLAVLAQDLCFSRMQRILAGEVRRLSHTDGEMGIVREMLSLNRR